MPPNPTHTRQNIRIVLVRARNPNNIGAVARAMHDFGFNDLAVVSDYPHPYEGARSAIDANDVLIAATTPKTVAEAVADCTLVIGTTAVGERDLQHPLLTLAEASQSIHSATLTGKVAILFGSEKTGLSNQELSHCHLLLTIPMHPHQGIRHPSMNLGQAVAVCLWELIRATPTPTAPETQPAQAADLDRIFTLFSELLEATEYTRRHAATAGPAHIRRLIHRMSLTAPDIPAWLGILRQILWKLRQPPS